jgi:hypothetical protein
VEDPAETKMKHKVEFPKSNIERKMHNNAKSTGKTDKYAKNRQRIVSF